MAAPTEGLFGLVRVVAGVYVFMVRATADSLLVLARLKYLPPTGDPVWRWRRR